MPVLNNAANLILGVPATKAMYRGQEIWNNEVPPAYAAWDPTRLGTGGGGVLSNDNRRFRRTSSGTGVASAISNTPLSGKVYYEVEVSVQGTTSASVGGGVAQQAAGSPGTAHGGMTTGGTMVYPRQFDYLNYWDGSVSPYSTIDNYGGTHPVYRFGIAVDVPNRLVWVRQVRAGGITLPWVGGESAPYQSGDPAGGLFPTRTLTGANPLYAFASVEPVTETIYVDLHSDPATHYAAAPSGFTAGIPV